MSRPRGGIIADTFPAWTTTSTSGVFTLREAQELRAANTWPRGPVAPTSLSASTGNAQLSLSWTAPATTHGTITNYLVEYTASGGSAQYVLTNSTSTSYTLTGLTNGTQYTVRVAAVNFTAGDYSGTATGTPVAAPPVTLNSGSGNGTAASKWTKGTGPWPACDFWGKFITANSPVTVLVDSVSIGGACGCDGGNSTNIQHRNASNAILNSQFNQEFTNRSYTLAAGDYLYLDIQCQLHTYRAWIA